MSTNRIADIISKAEEAIVSRWLEAQMGAEGVRKDLITEKELRTQSAEFLSRFRQGQASGGSGNIKSSEWVPTIEFLTDLSRQRARMGFTPTETALFVLSLKEPLSEKLWEQIKEPAVLMKETSGLFALLDKLGLYTTESFLKSREEVILRQQEDMLELSTPVVKLWDGIVALPIIGTLDSARTSVVMETLLQKIVETGSEIAIIDITGVLTVDTLVAQHLLKTVAAARLMGADCIISGIRPQIAQTMVHLAIDMSTVTTKSTMAEALKLALERSGYRVAKPVATV